jgi:phosphatidylserine/phosphatidylglycerophosphate/cardiolipin synthase-like enzyme
MLLGRDNLQFYLATRVKKTDSNLTLPVVSAIRSARKVVYLATQQLEDKAIVDELLAARKRKCLVKVFLETDYLTESPGIVTPWESSGDNEQNRKILSALLRGNIAVQLDRQSALFHSNFVVCDPDTANAQVLVSSANLTPSCLKTHWNATMVLKDRKAAKAFSVEFDQNWDDSSRDKGRENRSAPGQGIIGSLDVKFVFGPRHQPEMEVMKQIAKAKQKVRFAMYTFSQTSGIDDVLTLTARQGIDIAGVLDEQSRNQKWVASHGLAQTGVRIAWLGSDTKKLHHKLLTVDDKVAVFGTFNFSQAARFSHETILVVGSTEKNTPEQTEFVTGVSREIDRLIAVGRR